VARGDRGLDGRSVLGHMLALVTIALAIPAVLGLVHLTRAGRPLLAHLGAALAIVGFVGFAAFVGMELVLWQAAKNSDAAAMTALIDQVNDAGGLVPLYIAVLGFPIGFLLLGIALLLTKTAPSWVAALIGIAPVINLGSELALGPRWLTVAGAALFLVGMGWVGYGLLTETDEEWEAVAATAS
jgi:hypothetical protein